ncbi:NAD(P)/FAD-dependent oxidoreductase [Pseudopedobacter beijingensis]|uniref:NAD(P)/FAD-dependent oxidoreductase n=1 Tax=Pseudopedobacter beijingensis TaxID=1207056 RepID=A0ABW4ICN9_9SPHI
MEKQKHVDVIIIGGSYAGLSAAMALGRSLRQVVVIDSGFPCNSQTPHSHNFITQDGETPAAIAQKAKEQVLQYSTVSFIKDIAIGGEKTESGLKIVTQKGEIFTARKLIFATGIKDLMPGIKGFSECWGISVIHCPYCHGYEVRNKKTGIIANGERASHYAQLIYNWSKDITIFTNGPITFPPELVTKFRQKNIAIVDTEIVEIQHNNGQLNHILFKDGSIFNLSVIYAGLDFIQHCKIAEELGCELTELGHIKVDAFQKTNMANVFACGDNSSMMRSVANAVATGNLAGAMANNEMVSEDFK